MVSTRLSLLLHTGLFTSIHAFLPSSSTRTYTPYTLPPPTHSHRVPPLPSTPQSTTDTSSTTPPSLILISPPGGLGELTALQSALSGSTVQWFIVRPNTQSSPTPTLSSSSLSTIQSVGGSLSLAGASADTLLLPSTDPESALKAVGEWCRSNQPDNGDVGVVCVVDGVGESVSGEESIVNNEENKDAEGVLMDALKVATREVCRTVGNGVRVAVLPSGMDVDREDDEDGGEGGGGGLLGIGNPFGGKEKVDVPTSLYKAMGVGEGGRKRVTVRYGQLFGLPESAEKSSPFIGGPRRTPVLRDEYTMRSIRIDPTLSLSGNNLLSSTTRTSRHSLATLASRIALNRTPPLEDNLDVCLTSLRGMDLPSDEEWEEEFDRVTEIMRDTGGSGARLFTARFGGVPNVSRLTDWIATKWAPAVLRTYDIAGIRVGARPVFAAKVGENVVEIEWQILRDFKTFVVGKMVIEVEEGGITAVRAAGSVKDGYGTVSRKPLQGEDILVRRLSDAVTQAVEKGLATKAKPKKKARKVETVEAPAISTMVSSGSMDAPAVVAPTPEPAPAAADAGPRSAGTRRSAARKRGTRKKDAGTDSSNESPSQPPSEGESKSGSWQ